MRKIIPTILIFIGYNTLPIFVLVLTSYYYYYDYILYRIFPNKIQDEIFDFIVVGGGSAGGILAAKISRYNKVLLLEAGGIPIYFNSIPGFATELINYPEFAWIQETTPQRFSCFGSLNNSMKLVNGKMLGGGSSLNYMIYEKGNPKDYDNWARITQDSSWSYANIAKYFVNDEIKTETNKWKPLLPHFMNAGKEMGNGTEDFEFRQIELSQRNGKRHGSYEAFLQNIKHRKNLYISLYSEATKIIFNKSNRAIGVRYFRHGKMHLARCSKEVILSAGAVGSPKLLLLSGVGPNDHLENLKIPVKADLPVGKNFQDHIMTMILNIQIDDEISMIPERDFDLGVQFDYLLFGRGPLTSSAGAQGQIFLSTKESEPAWPDIQIFLFGIGNFETQSRELSRQFNLKAGILQNLTRNTRGSDGFILSPSLVRPKSRGEILLRDKNPKSSPIVNPNYLKDPQDVKALVEGIKFCLRLIENTSAFKKLNTRLESTPLPGCEKEYFRSDKYWECYVRQLTLTLYHPSGTCRMGQGINDKDAVVDSKLRVLQTTGLRVVDASIMPSIVNSNTNAPVVMIGEKASNLIREYWSEQYLVCPTGFPLSTIEFNQMCFYSYMV